MTAGMGIAALLIATPLVAILKPDSEIELRDRSVRVADVATIVGGDPASRAALGRRIIAAVPAARGTVALSRTGLSALLRRTVPSVRVAGGEEGQLRLRVAPRPSARSGEAHCLAVAMPVPRDEILSLDAVRPVACDDDQAVSPVAFDRRSRVARAGADLGEGAYLGRLALPPERGVDHGDRLTLRSVVGPVRIEREVVALQRGQVGHRVFVRDQDGEMLAVRISELQQEGDR